MILAEIGEVALAREVQTLAFEQRIKKLELFLAMSAVSPTTAVTSDEDRTPAPTVAGT